MPRLFIALPVPAEVAKRLARFMSSVTDGWRRVKPDSLHLTLAFLGNVDERSVGSVGQALHRAAAQVAQFDLSIGGIGGFPTDAKAKVLWAGVRGELSALHVLHDRLRTELHAEGFQLEERPYQPHVTVARSRYPRRVPIHLDPNPVFGEWLTEEVVLFESELISSGPRYLIRDRATLHRVAQPAADSGAEFTG